MHYKCPNGVLGTYIHYESPNVTSSPFLTVLFQLYFQVRISRRSFGGRSTTSINGLGPLSRFIAHLRRRRVPFQTYTACSRFWTSFKYLHILGETWYFCCIFYPFSKAILYFFTTVGVMSADCLDVHSQGDSLTPSVTPSIPHATVVVMRRGRQMTDWGIGPRGWDR